ncbi:MAG: right-handed parallel beta-helix repeat-containing protein [Pseudomonadota bacterium]
MPRSQHLSCFSHRPSQRALSIACSVGFALCDYCHAAALPIPMPIALARPQQHYTQRIDIEPAQIADRATSINKADSNAATSTFTVNSAVDSHDSDPADGQCLDASAYCSLRAAVEQSNALSAYPPEIIILPAGTYTLTLGELVIKNSLDLQGAGAEQTFIDGNAQSRVIAIDGEASPILHFSGITIQNGNGGTFEAGGGIFVDEKATLALFQCVVRNNKSTIFGGGISVAGQLQISQSTVQGNSLPLGSGGGQTSSGGGIFLFSSASVKIDKSTISGNVATRGGGIRNVGGHLEISNSTISGNIANTRGGGLMNYGTAFISYSTIVYNQANASLQGTIEDAFGGGIYNVSGLDASGNPVGGTVSMGNTILALNTDRRDRLDPTHYSPDCYSVGAATFTSFRGNLVGVVNAQCNLRDSTWGDLRFDQAGRPDMPLDPLLDTLSNNGGFTHTHALRSDSPAIDKGTGITSATFFDCPATDQRAESRPAGKECDVGAFEKSVPELQTQPEI